jgi:hypothetical protein
MNVSDRKKQLLNRSNSCGRILRVVHRSNQTIDTHNLVHVECQELFRLNSCEKISQGFDLFQ